ncbi:D-alanyl-D-alanine carboxypeptidase [Streptomyces sp. AcH 505]|uniref:D-alanyl-D-alanine carboxypeptidase family protein n=1 Tax=Streptomyces sp. AcH 505 TaxID=352211 RepID=UPI000591A78B|nr:D-alanyl-D-alanine carboxypeptidase [Streptomyces sp. AcH 505]
MIIRSVTRSALAGTVALAAGLLVLVPAPSPAAADPRTDPSARPVQGARSDRAALPADPALLYGSGTQVRTAPGAPALPSEVSALSWLVSDADTGAVIAAHDAHRRLPPASTLKTLFALTALPHLPAQTLHRVTSSDLAGIGEGSSLVGVVPGHTYRVADLWRGVFLSSGNDAVHVLAAMNGGVESTVSQMQRKAQLLGALDTHVVSPDGYDMPGQVSSAYDLAVFGRAGLADPQFVGYSSTADAQFPGDKTATFGIQNTNRLLSGADGVTRYPGLIGVKNGYTTNAGNTLVAAARHGSRTVLVTVMNPQSGESNAVYAEARRLLDWGFAAAGHVRPVGSLQPAPVVPPKLPTTPDTVRTGTGALQKALDTAHGAHGAHPAALAGADAAEGEPASAYILPLALTGSAALGSIALFVFRRTGRRRGGPTDQ